MLESKQHKSEKDDLKMSVESNNMIRKTQGFALGRYNKPLSSLQLKLQALALVQISEDENPEAEMEYEIDIRKFKQQLDLKGHSVLKNIKTAIDKLMEVDPTIHFDTGVNYITARLFQSVRLEKATNKVYIRFSYEIRKYLIEMKKRFDITYPIKTILSFERKYTPLLYDFLLAKIDYEKHDGVKGNVFNIESTPDEIMSLMNYDGIIGNFHKVALFPAIKDLNKHSEIYIDSDMPEMEREGKKILKYIFHITLRANVSAPMFAINMASMQPALLESKKISAEDEYEFPDLEYIIEYLKILNVNDKYITKIRNENIPQKAWRSLLYTWYQKKSSPMYFNNTYENDYGENENLEKMFNAAIENGYLLQDDVVLKIVQFYKNEPKRVHAIVERELSRGNSEYDGLSTEEMLKKFHEKMKF